MSRLFRARRARLWTAAGLTLLSGCGGAASETSTAARLVEPKVATSDTAPERSLNSRHTLDGNIRPVWYEFEDPPVPSLHAADGRDVGDDSEGNASRHEPTIVLPSADSNPVQRLPPVGSETSQAPPPRYDLPSRYSDGESDADSDLDNVAPQRAQKPSGFMRLPPPPSNDNAPVAPRETSGGAFRRLPPVEYAPPVERAPAVESQPAAAPVYPSPTHNDGPSLRPSDFFSEEAHPIGRDEKRPVLQSSPNRWPAESNQSPVIATPDYEPQSSPIVLPPASSDSVLDRTPSASVHPPRHREMQLINDRAGEGVRRGFELAHRGALYSAQAEFAAALRTIAQALDAQENSTRHAESLAAGLAALDESEDFLASARSSAATVDVATIVAKHRTPVLKDAPKEDLTPITALQRYYTFAQEQLAAAVENEPAASQALYGMGKVQTTLQSTRTATVADGPKAIALHQAALIVDNRNFMAANELGVLMARCGRYDAARAALAHSVSIAPQPAVWRNLAAVHDQLGETTLAANARAAATNTAPSTTSYDGSPAMPQKPVMWLDPGAFAQSAQPQSDLQRGQPAATSAATPAAATPNSVPHTSEKKSGMKWPLW
jgi:tetratricopeptide (TPR) repeat protein